MLGRECWGVTGWWLHGSRGGLRDFHAPLRELRAKPVWRLWNERDLAMAWDLLLGVSVKSVDT